MKLELQRLGHCFPGEIVFRRSKAAHEYDDVGTRYGQPSRGGEMLAVIDFSGRYDLSQTISYNIRHPRSIYFVEAATLGTNVPPHGPAKIIFKSRDQQLWETVRRNYPDASVRDIRDIRGEPLLTVATLPNHPTIGPGPPPVK